MNKSWINRLTDSIVEGARLDALDAQPKRVWSEYHGEVVDAETLQPDFFEEEYNLDVDAEPGVLVSAPIVPLKVWDDNDIPF